MRFPASRLSLWMKFPLQAGLRSADVLRFVAKVEYSEDGCWLWTASVDSYGYGQFHMSIGPKTRKAHRVAFELEYGPVPEGLEPDHTCRVNRCVRPEHLEAVPHQENIDRAFRSRSHFRCGHSRTPENIYVRPSSGHRRCRICKSRQEQAAPSRRAS